MSLRCIQFTSHYVMSQNYYLKYTLGEEICCKLLKKTAKIGRKCLLITTSVTDLDHDLYTQMVIYEYDLHVKNQITL